MELGLEDFSAPLTKGHFLVSILVVMELGLEVLVFSVTGCGC